MAPWTHPLAKALNAASLLLYSKLDAETTARVIDSALAASPDAPDLLRVRACIIRADAAHTLGDDHTAARLLDDVAAIGLDADDRAGIADDLARADELRLALSSPASA